MIVYTIEEMDADQSLVGVKSLLDLISFVTPQTVIVIYELPDEMPEADQVVFDRAKAVRLH